MIPKELYIDNVDYDALKNIYRCNLSYDCSYINKDMISFNKTKSIVVSFYVYHKDNKVITIKDKFKLNSLSNLHFSYEN